MLLLQYHVCQVLRLTVLTLFIPNYQPMPFCFELCNFDCQKTYYKESAKMEENLSGNESINLDEIDNEEDPS